MNMYQIVNFDDENLILSETTKDLIAKYMQKEVSGSDEEKMQWKESILFDIFNYRTNTKIVFDIGNVVGLIVCLKKTFYHHQILCFMYIEEYYHSEKIYSELCDCLSETFGNPRLAMFSPHPLPEIYINSGFRKANVKNPEKLSVYFRNNQGYSGLDIDSYYRKHLRYLKNYSLLYSCNFIVVVLFILFVFFGLIYNTNNDVNVFSSPLTYIITTASLLILTTLYFVLKKFNKKGFDEFGFQYSMVYINRNQHKFRNKLKEFILTAGRTYLGITK